MSVHIYAQPAPWLSDKELAEARKRNPPHRYARLFGGIWGSETGEGIPPANINAAIINGLKPTRRPKPGWVYVAGLDLSTSRDTTALVILGKKVGCNELIQKPRKHEPEPRSIEAMRELGMMPERPQFDEIVRSIPGSGKLRLAYVRHWKPKPGKRLKLSQVQAKVLEMHQLLGLSAVAFDPYEAHLMAEQLENEGLNMVRVPFSGPNLMAMASELLEQFADRNIELLDDAQLLEDLRRMNIVEKSYGMRLAAKRSNSQGHADCGTAVPALAVLAAREFTEPEGDEFLDDNYGPLILN